MKVTRRKIFTMSGSLLLAGILPSTASAVDEEYKEKFKEIVDGFGENLSENLEGNGNLLEPVSEDLSQVEAVDVADFEDGAGDTKEQLRRTQKIVEILNTDLNIDLPESYVSSIDTFDDKVNTVDKYLPVVAAGQNCLQCVEEYQNAKETGTDDEIEEAQEELVIAALIVAFEVVLLQSTTTYKLSFKGTRYVANHGLFRVQQHIGTRTYAMILSEVHWAIRGTLANVKSDIVMRTSQLVAEISTDLDLSELAKLSKLQNLDQDKLDEFEFLDSEASNDRSDTVDGGSDTVDETEDSRGSDDSLTDSVSDFIFGDNNNEDRDDGILSW